MSIENLLLGGAKYRKGAVGVIRKNKGLKGPEIFFAFLCVCMAAGCAKDACEDGGKERYTVGVVTKSKSSEYWMSVCSGMEKGAEDFELSVKFVSPDSESNDKMQKKMIHDLLQQDIDALAVSPVSSYDTEYLKEAEEKDVKVVGYDTKILSDGIPYIGIDNEKAGRELAAVMAEKLGGRGSVGIVAGDLRQTAHYERMEGIKEYIEEYTDIEIAFIESGYGNLLISEAEISRLLSEHPGVGGIFASSGVTALGISQYLGDSGIYVMTVDAQQDALDAVKRGDLTALAAQSGFEIGYETMRFIAENREKDSAVLEDRILDAEVLTKENVSEWSEQTDE